MKSHRRGRSFNKVFVHKTEEHKLKIVQLLSNVLIDLINTDMQKQLRLNVQNYQYGKQCEYLCIRAARENMFPCFTANFIPLCHNNITENARNRNLDSCQVSKNSLNPVQPSSSYQSKRQEHLVLTYRWTPHPLVVLL